MTRCDRTTPHRCSLGLHTRSQPERDWVPLFALLVIVSLILLGGMDAWKA